MCMCYVYNGDCLIPAVHKFIVTGAQDHSHHHKHGMRITIIFFPSVNVSCMMVESSHARPKLIWIFPCITHGLKVTVFMSWKWWLLSYLSSLSLKGLIVLSHHCLLVYHPLLLCETVSSGVMVQPGKPVEPHSLEPSCQRNSKESWYSLARMVGQRHCLHLPWALRLNHAFRLH